MRLKITLDQEDLRLGTTAFICAGFNCGDSHRPLVEVLRRLLLICTSRESANRGFSLRTSALAFTTQFPLCGRRRPYPELAGRCIDLSP